MLRTYFLQNKDWFANSDHPFSHFGDMDSEIAELRTMTKVTRLRKEIECREEGAWMVVKDIPDKSAPSGSRKVTAYGRTRRSVTRSVSSNADFDSPFPQHTSLEPLVQHPPEEDDEQKDSEPSAVEITEVFEEPLRVNIPTNIPQSNEKTNRKKTSVVTLGKGNLVLIDHEDESNFHVTGISKGKVADVVSTLEKSYEKKPKKVGFCKTEVHFAPDSGKINIVETDEKPPPTQVYRKKKRSRGVRSKQNSCLPKHYFGEIPDLGDDSNLSNESDREDSRLPLTYTHSNEAFPQVKQIFPTFEKTIKSENKDTKYRFSSPEKNDSDLEVDKFHLDEKDFFKKIKQPPFRDRFLKETEHLGEKMSSGFISEKLKKPTAILGDSHRITLNGHSSSHDPSDIYSKESYSNYSLNNIREDIDKKDFTPSEPELKYTEVFKIPIKIESDEESPKKTQDFKSLPDTSSIKHSEEPVKSDYGLLHRKKLSVDDKFYDLTQNVSKIPIDQDMKAEVAFIGSISPKLKSLIQNSVEHEFQLRQKQILQKRALEKKSIDSTKIKSTINISLSPAEHEKEEKSVVQKEVKLKAAKSVTQVQLGSDEKKHEFQLKREQITKNVFSEPTYNEGKFPPKEMPYLLKEEPVPAPREKSPSKQNLDATPKQPPKPKPRTIISTDSDRNRAGKVSSRHSVKSDTSSISRRVRSRENLLRSKDSERAHSRTAVSKEEGKARKTSNIGPSSIERPPKASTPARKTGRSEPLRSFEKVSNGWVGHCVVPNKHHSTSPNITLTTKVKTLAQQSTHHLSGVRKSTQSSTLKSSHSSRSEIGRGTKQFSLSKEHLSSAKLVRELSPRKSTKTKCEVKSARSKTVCSKEGSYRRARRDSSDSLAQADEEVRAYMFNTRTKVCVERLMYC
uniref:Unkown protein n=1 Tax=Riptortus pedestris TaxID=329032 RepID=R4WDN9_RIPPE|nr:unkown protein [Riptortus pedestris]